MKMRAHAKLPVAQLAQRIDRRSTYGAASAVGAQLASTGFVDQRFDALVAGRAGNRAAAQELNGPFETIEREADTPVPIGALLDVLEEHLALVRRSCRQDQTTTRKGNEGDAFQN